MNCTDTKTIISWSQFSADDEGLFNWCLIDYYEIERGVVLNLLEVKLICFVTT